MNETEKDYYLLNRMLSKAKDSEKTNPILPVSDNYTGLTKAMTDLSDLIKAGHKYKSRKKGKDGKWVYDYGDKIKSPENKEDLSISAKNKFNLDEFNIVSKRGSDRNVFDISQGRVIKVAKTERGLFQNKEEFAIKASFLPKVFEKGKDYIIVEKITIPEDNKKIDAVVDFFRSINDSSEARNKALDIAEKEFNLKGLSQFDGDNIIFGDLMNSDNWGIKNGQLKIIDGGIFADKKMFFSYK